MNETTKFILEKVTVPVASAIAGGLFILGVAGVQAADDDVNCSEVRTSAIEQHEKAPELTRQPYPADSPEQQDCKINTIQTRLLDQDEKELEKKRAAEDGADEPSPEDPRTGTGSSGGF